MIDYIEFQKLKEKLGEKVDYKEFVNIQKYLDENPNLLLTNLYYNKENWDQFEKWKFDNEIKNKKIFAVVFNLEDDNMKIDYLKIKEGKYGYTDGYFVYQRDQLFLSLEEAEKSLGNYRKGYTYTKATLEYIEIKEKDKKELTKEYYGKSKLENVWFQEIEELNSKKAIEKIYQVYTKGFLGAWYLIRDKEQNRYIVKHRTNDVNTKMMMSCNNFLIENECEEIESQEIQMENYDTRTKQEYNQMIFDYLIEFKNVVGKEYFKLNLNRIDIIEKFIEDYAEVFKKQTKKYVEPSKILKEDEELQECLISHIKFDVKCRIQSELNSLKFSKDNFYINKDNIEQFIDEFTRKAIYGEIDSQDKLHDNETTEDEEEQI